MKDLNECYRLLGVTKNSNAEDVKKAYRSKAKELHPDVNGGSKEAFMAVNQACSTILNHLENKKVNVESYSNYENTVDTSNDWFYNNTYSYYEEMGFGKTPFYQSAYEDVIPPPFTSNARGEDVYLEIDISQEEQTNYRSLGTISKRVSYNRRVKCNSCKGLGHKTYTCVHCNGNGYKEEVNYSPKYGKATTTTKCSVCKGNGYIHMGDKCIYCRGIGYIEFLFESDVPVDLISVMERGQRTLNFEGLGHDVLSPKEWGMSGNLVVKINLLKRVADSNKKIYISFVEAIEGCSIRVDLDEESKFSPTINIPPGIRSGTKLKVPKNDSLYFVEVLITVPKLTEMDKKARKLFMSLKEAL